MIISRITLLHNDKVHASPAEIGTTTKTKLVIDKFTKAVVEPLLTTVSTDSIIDVRLFSAFSFLFFFWVLSSK